MAHLEWLEGLGFAASAAGLLVVAAAVACPAAAPAGGARRDAIAAARDRLDLAMAARAEPRREAQFDAVVGSLAAGLGTDTPAELADAIELIRRGRERERARPTPIEPRRAEARPLEADVARGLALAERTLGRLEATDDDRPPAAVRGVGLAGLIAAALGTLVVAAARRPHGARRAVAVPQARAEGTRRAAAARQRAGRAPDALLEADDEEPALFGRVLEIVACDE